MNKYFSFKTVVLVLFGCYLTSPMGAQTSPPKPLENGDARPTDGAYQVFKELSAELARHLSAWEKVKESVEKL